MAYEFVENDSSVSGEEGLSSFWFYMPFTLTLNGLINPLTGDAGRGCFFAVLLDGPAAKKQPPKIKDALGVGKFKLEVKHEEHGSVVFDDYDFIRATRIRRNNEWSELRMYQGTTTRDTYDWVNPQNWSLDAPAITSSPTHWNRTFEFDQIKGSVDQSVVQYGASGQPLSVTLIRRLDKGGSICQKLATEGRYGAKAIPKLKLKTESLGSPPELPEETFFGQPTEGRVGFAMMAAGAFAFEEADTMIARWLIPGNEDNVLAKLCEVAFSKYDTFDWERRSRRKLYNVSNSRITGVFSGSGMDTNPVEVLHVYSQNPDAVDGVA